MQSYWRFVTQSCTDRKYEKQKCNHYFLILVAGDVLYQDDYNDNGKLYPNKEKLCIHFAQSYLRTVQKTDNARSPENISSSENQRWQMAADVETDFYNLCMLNLDEKSLKTYKSWIIEKFQK